MLHFLCFVFYLLFITMLLFSLLAIGFANAESKVLMIPTGLDDGVGFSVNNVNILP